jgi:hypothetical protein
MYQDGTVHINKYGTQERETMKARMFYSGLMLLSLLYAFAVPAQTASSQQTLNQYVADLQSNPNDAALRGKIIALAQTMKTPPAIPEEAREHYVMAATFMESAKDPAGFARAVEQYKAALLIAPWWADAYKKLAIAQKAANQFDDAIASLNLYLLTQPADARDAQDEIYKIKALKQSAADDQANQARRQQEEQQRQREEQQRAYAASPEGQFQSLLKKIDGRRYRWDHPNRLGDSYIDVKGGALVTWHFNEGKPIEGNRIEIKDRETWHNAPSDNPYIGGDEVYRISDDGERIIEEIHHPNGTVNEYIFHWQR